MTEVIVGLLLLVSGFFFLVAALGILRFPDLYTRTHAASKAGTLGVGCAFLAIAFFASDTPTVVRAIAGICFFLLTAPVAAHLLGRAAYCTGLKPWTGTGEDQLKGKYTPGTLKLASYDIAAKATSLKQASSPAPKSKVSDKKPAATSKPSAAKPRTKPKTPKK